MGWIWRAWNTLHHERPHTVEGFTAQMGGMMIRSVPGHIPWSVVLQYAQWHDYSRAETEFLWRVIEKMDATYLEWWSTRQRTT